MPVRARHVAGHAGRVAEDGGLEPQRPAPPIRFRDGGHPDGDFIFQKAAARPSAPCGT